MVTCKWVSTLRMRRSQFPPRNGNGGTKSRVRSATTIVLPLPKSCTSPIPHRPGGICIGPPPLRAFLCGGQLATNEGWRTQSQSSWKTPARHRIKRAIGRPPQWLGGISAKKDGRREDHERHASGRHVHSGSHRRSLCLLWPVARRRSGALERKVRVVGDYTP